MQKPAQNSKQPKMNARWKMQVYIYIGYNSTLIVGGEKK